MKIVKRTYKDLTAEKVQETKKNQKSRYSVALRRQRKSFDKKLAEKISLL
jgi:hypothetical protein